jgi:hypothetical protein
VTAAAAAAQPPSAPPRDDREAAAALLRRLEQQRAAARTPTPDEKGQPMPQGFSVVLVLGDNQLPSMADNVPAAARKALGDIKDFLPYRGYRLLDAQWILGSNHSTSRLRGPEDQEYELSLRSVAAAGGHIHVTFALQEPLNAVTLRKQEADDAMRRGTTVLAPVARDRGVIETSFAMDIGETVVVGTSRMRGGDKALIALLTAVPKGK